MILVPLVFDGGDDLNPKILTFPALYCLYPVLMVILLLVSFSGGPL